jgi:hypothetical protein
MNKLADGDAGRGDARDSAATEAYDLRAGQEEPTTVVEPPPRANARHMAPRHS